MKFIKTIIVAALLILMTTGSSFAQMSSTKADATQCKKSYYSPQYDHKAPHVDAYNFVRAETDMQMKGYASPPYNGFGKFSTQQKSL